MIEPFTWHDGARTIAFGRGRLVDAGEAGDVHPDKFSTWSIVGLV